MTFLTFMSSTAGRTTRVVVGLVLIGIGITLGGAGYAVAVIGLVPLAAGAADVCLFAPLAGRPLAGKALREADTQR